jgi:cytochrome P450
MRGGQPAGVDVSAFDLTRLPEAFYGDPYPIYDALRRTVPICRLPDGGLFLTRYADVQAIYLDADTFISEKRAVFAQKFGAGRLYRHHTTSLVFNDAPYHTRVRRLIQGALLPRAVAHRQPALEALVARLIKALEERGGGDLIADFAAAIPVEVIGDLLQVPQDERGPLRRWFLAILHALEPQPGPQILQDGEAALADFHGQIETLISERRARPRDPKLDILTRLIQGEGNGERLTQAELLENCVFLLNAGHETTTNLIGNLLETLSRFPGERRRLAETPDLIHTAVEEALRFESSNQLGNRRTARKAVIGGYEVPAGIEITLCIGAANRDPDAFPEPHRFDVTRAPNRHLAFGGGVHACAGMHLARLEAKVAVSAFVAAFPRYEILPGAERSRRARFRGFQRLPAALEAAR